MPDARLSNYRIVRLLGTGGMGSVYLARDLMLDRDVAIKFISPERAVDAAARRRLVREARAAAALDHPNICAVYEVIDDPNGQACIVMQYVEGETVAQKLERGPLDLRQALTVAGDVAAALAAAHKRGIIHRDLKPQNIVVTPAQRAKLLDFGIARMSATLADESEATQTSLTNPGILVGTPAYMSPEQTLQRPLDGRSDLFALGSVLFECLTGRRAFDGRSPAEVSGQILYTDPPAVSSLREGLTDREDELCRRLLAKHPDDRFASAEELLGALRVLRPGTTDAAAQPSLEHAPAARFEGFRRWRTVLAAAASIAVIGAIGIWRWDSPRRLPVPTVEAQRWYARGTESIRDGAYQSGRLALQEAINVFPGYAQAYARLAEAHSELDDEDAAERALLTVDKLVSDESRLPTDDALRLKAMRALILRDVTAAVGAYTELAGRRPNDADVWVDLGRAQETAALNMDARTSYDRAISIDSQYAGAHLRRASILAQEGSGRDALTGYAEAERLYRAASNVEGEAEALLRRGAYLNAGGELGDARIALERARVLAAGLKSPFHEIRARLLLSSVTASEGHFGEAERLAQGAVAAALEHGLETVAADGLLDLENTLLRAGRYDEADAQLSKARRLAEKRHAQRIVARVALQQGALLLQREQPEQAISTVGAALDFIRSHHYRRYELYALSIISRAHELLENYGQAREIAGQMLKTAEELKDDAQAAGALENLAGSSTSMGSLPDALAYREREYQIHRRQRDVASLAYDLTNRAELLVRLGRHDDAEGVLQELDAGIAGGVEAYKARARRATLVRALNAICLRRLDEGVRLAREVIKMSAKQPDATARLATLLIQYAGAHASPGGRGKVVLPESPPNAGPEERYWRLAAALAAGNAAAALDGATRELDAGTAVASVELEWRLAAIGAAAARRIEAHNRAQALAARAQKALERLHETWKHQAPQYDTRADLVELRRLAGLTTRS